MEVKESGGMEYAWYQAVLKNDSRFKEATLDVSGVSYYKLEKACQVQLWKMYSDVHRSSSKDFRQKFKRQKHDQYEITLNVNLPEDSVYFILEDS